MERLGAREVIVDVDMLTMLDGLPWSMPKHLTSPTSQPTHSHCPRALLITIERQPPHPPKHALLSYAPIPTTFTPR